MAAFKTLILQFVMWKCHILLIASTFHSCKLIKELLEDKFSYCKVQIKSIDQYFQKRKWRKPHIITTFTPFLESSLLIFDYFKLRMQGCIIFPTTIIKMCSIPCYNWFGNSLIIIFRDYTFMKYTWKWR